MFAVEVYAAVRQFVFVEGHSRREAAHSYRLRQSKARRRIAAEAEQNQAADEPIDPETGEITPD